MTGPLEGARVGFATDDFHNLALKIGFFAGWCSTKDHPREGVLTPATKMAMLAM